MQEGNDLGRSRPGPGAALLLRFYFLGEACPSVLLLVNSKSCFWGKQLLTPGHQGFSPVWHILSMAGLGGLPALYGLGKVGCTCEGQG